MNNEDQNQPVPPTEGSPSPDPVTRDSLPTPPTNVSPVADTPTPPVSSDQPQPPAQSAVGAQPQSAQHHTDGLGIASIILAFVGLQLVGLILGLIGASQAKKQGRSATLSRVGWILNLVFMVVTTVLIILLVFAGSFAAREQAHDTERMSDVNNIHSKLEEFYSSNGYYPAEISTTTLTAIDPEALKDSNGSSYTYTPSPAGCTQCASYEISTTLERPSTLYPGGVYTKQSLNSSVDETYMGRDGTEMDIMKDYNDVPSSNL